MNRQFARCCLSLPCTPVAPCVRRACIFFATFFLCASLAGNAQKASSDPGLIAHEWGTFTSIAGETGQAVEWLPLNSPGDLPGFVEHFRGTGFKVGLGGTIRMETPVLYFYSTHDTAVDVSVSFFHGLITEWYPHATHIEPSSSLNNVVLFQQQSSGSISWKSVSVQPSADFAFPQESQSSHYYAARNTNSSSLRISTNNGDESEKFLFYRGVSVAPAPLSALVLPNGQIEAINQSAAEVPKLILFERRGEKLGFREVNSLREGAILDPPVLNASLDSLLPDLEASLISSGLYPEEAHAMLESWKDSWFEEGSRLIYIVPNSFVGQILPLSIEPQPATVHRVFVGRMELLTPATQNAIETAAGTQDKAALSKYGRFLAPMIEMILHKNCAERRALTNLRASDLKASDWGRAPNQWASRFFYASTQSNPRFSLHFCHSFFLTDETPRRYESLQIVGKIVPELAVCCFESPAITLRTPSCS
jgi:hypothetical protein